MRRRSVAIIASSQKTLFDIDELRPQCEPAPGSLDVAKRLREALSEALKACPLSRYGVAARMSELVGVEITKTQLDSWTADSKEGWRFPAEYLPAFCVAVGNVEPMRLLVEPTGCHLVESQEALLAELGRIDHMRRELAQRERVLRRALEGALRS